MRKKLFLIVVNLALLLPGILLAACSNGTGPVCLNLDYPEFTVLNAKYDLNNTQDLNQIVAWFYYFIIIISGFAAFVMLIFAGFKYLASAGNPTAISDAKDIIKNALWGLLLILISYLILQVINPDLILLKNPVL